MKDQASPCVIDLYGYGLCKDVGSVADRWSYCPGHVEVPDSIGEWRLSG